MTHNLGHPKDATIKEMFHKIKDDKKHGSHHAAHFMKNVKNQLRLIFWETTAGCNLECVHCRRLDVSKELMRDDLTTEQSFQLIDNIASVGKPILVLSGGEPLFRPDIFDIAKYGVKKV